MKKIFLKNFKYVFFSSLLVSLSLFEFVKASSPTPTPGVSNNKTVLESKIKELEEKIASTQTTEKSLKSEISNLDNQITATNYKIQVAEDDIKDKEREIGFLKNDISFLEERLVKIKDSIAQYEKLVDVRMREKYKSTRSSGSLSLLLADENGFTNFISRLKYVKVAEDRDRNLLMEMKAAENSYQSQQGVLQDKKDEITKIKTQIEAQKKKMEGLRANLDVLQEDKKRLLEITKNSEVEYQRRLDATKAELESINAILEGKGVEDNGSPVKEGQRIASIIPGPSCNSGGAHLHFLVKKQGYVQNPFNYLKKISSFENDSGGDPFNPKGSWDWPLNGYIYFNQGYGYTWAIRNRVVWYNSHDGIDIYSNNLAVYAVRDGTYYRGSYVGTNGCKLPYVRLDHKDGIQTYYLHVNY